ncbi:hypothetical protein BDP27DRAFT_1426329 [Rhodocollybia butyracea]|uniref:Uncharacterized protein n=1 Tax=Rhodocollybia butyracea TaxID=206335 RepID=A0A9P5U2I2_9AGAR|nr:hypothetical protein BDP27DRAFT_1426329 [Rhodocollybia butyracea]
MSASKGVLLSGTEVTVPAPQSMAAHPLKAVDITGEYRKAAEDVQPNGKMELTPPYGTHGFVNKVYRVGEDWVVNVYAYLHIKSDKVTFVLLHSGSFGHTESTDETKSTDNAEGYPRTVFSLWTEPESENVSHNPMTYDSKLDDDRYSYHIDYAETINMLGPGGKNPIVFQPMYNDTFSAQLMGSTTNTPPYLNFFQSGSGQIRGLSVLHTKFGSSSAINFKFGSGRIENPDQVVGIIPTSIEIRRSEFD